MEVRRHLLPAIYNVNRERYHWEPSMNVAAQNNDVQNDAIVVKDEPIEFLNFDGLIWITDDENEMYQNAEDHQAVANDETDSNTSFADSFILANDGAQSNGSNENIVIRNVVVNSNENGEPHPKKIKKEINFLHLPNEIIDLSDDDMIRSIMAFNNNGDINERIAEEADYVMKWFDPYPQPIITEVKNEVQLEGTEGVSRDIVTGDLIVRFDVRKIVKQIIHVRTQ